MASEIVAKGAAQASTDHFIDTTWMEIERGRNLPVGMSHMLRKADKTLFAGSQIARLLLGDSNAKQTAESADGGHVGLCTIDIEALGIALVELLDTAYCELENVREKELDRLQEQAVLEAVKAAA